MASDFARIMHGGLMGRRRRLSINSKAIYGGVAALAVLTGGVVFAAVQGDPDKVSPEVVASYNANIPKVVAPPVAAVEKLTVTRTAGQPLRMLVAGDSLSQGRFATLAEEAYVPLVETALSKRGPVETDIIGDSGNTTTDVLPSVTSKRYDFIILELGTNDAGEENRAFAQDYPKMVKALRKASPKAALLCTGSWQTNYRAGMVDPTIQKVCTDNGGRYVRLNPLFNDAATRGPDKKMGAYGLGDTFHPNSVGHRRIADGLLAQIKI